MKVRYIILCMLFTVNLSSQDRQSASVYRSADPAVVCLESLADEGPARLGSGFFVAPGVIATVSHQIAKATKIIAYLSDGTSRNVTLPLAGQGREVALLTVPATI